MAETGTLSRGGYHHGNLQEALIDATIQLIEKHGVEKLSVREVAKLAGVSPGAPFRHFSSKKALLTAVAEQSADRLNGFMGEELALCDHEDPIASLRAIGRGYMKWVFYNPTQFEVVSSRSLIDFQASTKLVQSNGIIHATIGTFIRKAQEQGRANPELPVDDMIFSSRAFVYGVARMYVDGHFVEWNTTRPPLESMFAALDLFINSLEIKKA